MTAEMRQAVMKKATKTFELQKVTASTLAMHQKRCTTCASKVRSFFFRCATGEELEFEARIAKAEADLSRDAVNLLKLESPVRVLGTPGQTPTVQWLDSLYKLEDKREK